VHAESLFRLCRARADENGQSGMYCCCKKGTHPYTLGPYEDSCAALQKVCHHDASNVRLQMHRMHQIHQTCAINARAPSIDMQACKLHMKLDGASTPWRHLNAEPCRPASSQPALQAGCKRPVHLVCRLTFGIGVLAPIAPLPPLESRWCGSSDLTCAATSSIHACSIRHQNSEQDLQLQNWCTM